MIYDIFIVTNMLVESIQEKANPVLQNYTMRFMSSATFLLFVFFLEISFAGFSATPSLVVGLSPSKNVEAPSHKFDGASLSTPASSLQSAEFLSDYATSQLKSLVALARSPNPAFRARAIEGLKHSNSEDATDAIIGALIDPVPEVREAALNAILEWDEARLYQSIIKAYASADRGTWQAYDQILPLFSLKLATPFQRILADTSANSLNRRIAAHCLGAMRVQDAVKALADVVWLNDEGVAAEGAWALVMLGSPESVPDFVRMTYHTSKEVRRAAVEGLGRLSIPASLRALESIASDRQIRDRDIRREAVLWLGVIGDNQTVDTLISILRNEPFLRRAGTQALRRLTGLPYGDAPREWYEWYTNYKQSTQPQTSPPPAPPLVPRGVVLPAVPPGFVPGSPGQTEEQQKKKP